jgi:CcmD family protein
MTRLRQWIIRAALAAAALVCSAAGVLAQQGDKGYVPLPPGQSLQEQLPATPLVFTAYAFVWVALLVYVMILFSRLKKIERELADVRSKTRASRA